MNTKNIIISIAVVIILGLVGWAYWYFMMGPVAIPVSPTPSEGQPGFQPLNRNTPAGQGGQATSTGELGSTNILTTDKTKLPTLRLLSDTPVGGYGASTTATTTNVLWVDRGRGNVYRASYNSSQIVTLSNTVVPKIFNSIWNKNLTAFIGSLLEDGDLVPTNVYSELVRQGTTTPAKSSLAPYELRGKNIPGNLIGYAASPDKSKLIMVMDESGMGVGYISSFSGQGMTRLFSTPLTQINVAWPTDNAIAISTKGSASYPGFLYLVSPKTGVWSKILGPMAGLSAVVSHDGKYVLYSATGKNSEIQTSIYSIASGTSTDALIKTLADKCAWGNFYKDLVFCGVPSQQMSGIYPDGWYLGSLSSVDKIWQVNAATGEVHLIASLVDQADRTINAFRLDLDPKDKYLFFMNKNDLSLWSLAI